MEPLVPADVDLRDFAFMPVDVQRLLTSETWILGSGDERAAAMTLWLVSWHQVPAASLPDNDKMLSHLSQSKNWARIKKHALRGWVLAADGRYYHPVVAEKALEAWLEKLAQRLSGGAGNAKRWGLDFDPTPIEEAIRESRALLSALNPQSRALSRKRTAAIASGQKRDSGCDRGAIPSGSQETGTGTGTGREELKSSLRSDSSSASPDDAPSDAGKTDDKAQRLAEVTDEAIAAWNASKLVKPNGGLLATVNAAVGRENRRNQVKRCVAIARDICREQGHQRIPPEFWAEFFAVAAKDDFHSGRQGGGRGHENWTPDFEYMTQPKTMLKLFERVESEEVA